MTVPRKKSLRAARHFILNVALSRPGRERALGYKGTANQEPAGSGRYKKTRREKGMAPLELGSLLERDGLLKC
jgi:hypothetical protein